MKKNLILLILDGWGIGKREENNPLHSANPKTLEYLKRNFPSGSLQSAGIAVGLPWGEPGNSEIGHLSIGSGKIIYQSYPRISLLIKTGEFFKNEKILEAIKSAKEKNANLHYIGLLSSSNIDSSFEHLEALIKMADSENTPYFLHLFTDGKDSPIKSAATLIKKLPDQSKISSLSGRFYAMDENENWDRTEKVYKILTGQNKSSKSISEVLESAYSRNLSDEFIEPSLVGENPQIIKDNDSVIFFNFSEDSSWQLASSFIDKSFEEFARLPLKDISFVTFTEYDPGFFTSVAFPQDSIINPLGKIISDQGKTHIKIGETLKYYPLTYFLNGFNEKPFPNEYRVLIPSNSTPHQDQFPAMRASEITARAIQSINENVFNLIIVNYANFDIIGHTGNLAAAKSAVKLVDDEVNKVVRSAIESKTPVILVGSHGNIEEMVNPKTGLPETKNTKNSVPFILIDRDFERKKSESEVLSEESTTIGLLSDVAPTILELLGIEKPNDMTGQSLLKYIIR
ncbi:MAG: 2,3-bisphosphoglycerate-independent phosphoglycerate mutase [Candidatus Pacebacteria bacterium]|nr:2,3-bisphosphoglycerate-independent phosphoglycerate mutase [Candidatus Paceibacterota bacterium]